MDTNKRVSVTDERQSEIARTLAHAFWIVIAVIVLGSALGIWLKLFWLEWVFAQWVR